MSNLYRNIPVIFQLFAQKQNWSHLTFRHHMHLRRTVPNMKTGLHVIWQKPLLKQIWESTFCWTFVDTSHHYWLVLRPLKNKWIYYKNIIVCWLCSNGEQFMIQLKNDFNSNKFLFGVWRKCVGLVAIGLVSKYYNYIRYLLSALSELKHCFEWKEAKSDQYQRCALPSW